MIWIWSRGRPLTRPHRVYFLRGGVEYALVPGGEVTVGYDGTRSVPDRELVELLHWSEYGDGEDYDEHGWPDHRPERLRNRAHI